MEENRLVPRRTQRRTVSTADYDDHPVRKNVLPNERPALNASRCTTFLSTRVKYSCVHEMYSRANNTLIIFPRPKRVFSVQLRAMCACVRSDKWHTLTRARTGPLLWILTYTYSSGRRTARGEWVDRGRMIWIIYNMTSAGYRSWLNLTVFLDVHIFIYTHAEIKYTFIHAHTHARPLACIYFYTCTTIKGLQCACAVLMEFREPRCFDNKGYYYVTVPKRIYAGASVARYERV